MTSFGRSARLFALGCLRRGPRHGYAIRQEAVQDQVERWANLKPGSVYYALGALERDGLVTVEHVGADTKRPTRTSFALTPSGRAELKRLIASGICDVSAPDDSVAVALRLGDELDPAELRQAVAERVEALTKLVAEHRAALAHAAPHLSVYERIAFDHTVDALAFEADWFSRLKDRLTNQSEETR